MIKFIGTLDGKDAVGVGLTRDDMMELLKGQPLVVAFERPDVTLTIIGAETEQTMRDVLGTLKSM